MRRRFKRLPPASENAADPVEDELRLKAFILVGLNVHRGCCAVKGRLAAAGFYGRAVLSRVLTGRENRALQGGSGFSASAGDSMHGELRRLGRRSDRLADLQLRFEHDPANRAGFLLWPNPLSFQCVQ